MSSTENQPQDLGEASSSHLVEELRQHQFELQQQNEELRRTHWELTRATERSRSLWNDAPVGYLSHDRIGVISTANERAKNILGKVARVTEGATFPKFLDRQSQLVFRQHLWAVADSSANLDAELRLATGEDEVEIWIRIESTAAAGGEIRSALIDISDRKMAEAERLSMEAQLRHSQKMEVLHELSSGIAHDFNNILQVVIGYAEFLRADMLESGQEICHADALLAGANRGIELTRRLLAFSRKSTLQARATDLRQIVENTVAFARRTVGDNIVISSCCSKHPLPVCVDSSLLEQATLNLCLNARDAMPHGGKLCVTSDSRSFAKSQIINGCKVESGDYAAITVADDGSGMSDDTLQKVFEPFFTTKSTSSGTGLGLSIAYGIIRQHRGAISVKSTLGQGSSFTIVLPVSSEVSDAPGLKPKNSDYRKAGTGSILLAEDEPAIREIISAILRKAGYRVVVADDGQQAIEILDRPASEFDILLTDAVMPRASGKQVCERFRLAKPEAPVFFLTGHGDSVVDHEFLVQHRADLLTKPISSKSLLVAIEKRLASTLERVHS